MHNLKLDSITTNIECSCLLFEFRGILYRHSFLILGQEDIECVAEKYVLRHWFKNVQRRHSLINASYNRSIDDPRMQRYQVLCKTFYDIAEVACDSKNETKQLCDELHLIAKSLGVPTKPIECVVPNGGGCLTSNHVTPSTTNSRTVLSLIHVKRKGRPCSNRIQSTVEKICKRKRTNAYKNKASRTLMVNTFYVIKSQ